MIVERIPAIQQLSTQEKHLLMSELWEDVEIHQGDIPFDDAVLRLLNERFEACHKNPASAISWDDFRMQMGRR